MKTKFLLPALLFLGFATAITSCKKKKDDDVTPTNPIIPACTVQRALTSNDSTEATYDSGNRLVKDQTFTRAGNSKGYTLYEYPSNKIIAKRYNESGNLSSQTDYYLNSSNNASYSVKVEEGDTDNADTTWYVYDGSNHNTRRVVKNTSTVPIVNIKTSTYDTTWYTYSGDNLSKIETRLDNGDVVTTIYSYGSVDAKSKFLVPGQDSGVLGLFGKTSAKLPVSATSGSTTYSYNYSYNLAGYVTHYQVIKSGVLENDTRYVYMCK